MEGFSSNHQLDHSCSPFPYINYYLAQDLPTTTNHYNLEVTGSSSMVYSASPMACGTSKYHDGPSGATNGAIATQASSSTTAALLTSPQHRDGSETSRSRKHVQKRGNGGGYIHVRARRGQAIDSHS